MSVSISGFRLYKKTDDGDEFLQTLSSDKRSLDVLRTMAIGEYGISAYKMTGDTEYIESARKYFTVNPFYKVELINVTKGDETVDVSWKNQTNVNYYTGYYIYLLTITDGVRTYTEVTHIDNDVVSYSFNRDAENAYTYVISPITYENFHDADGGDVEVLSITIPAVMLNDPVETKYYRATWSYAGDSDYVYPPQNIATSYDADTDKITISFEYDWECSSFICYDAEKVPSVVLDKTARSFQMDNPAADTTCYLSATNGEKESGMTAFLLHSYWVAPSHYTELEVSLFAGTSASTDTDFNFVVLGNDDMVVEAIPADTAQPHRIYKMSVDGSSNKMTAIVHVMDTIRIYTAVPRSGMLSNNNGGDYALHITKFDSGWTTMDTVFASCGNLTEIETWEGAENVTSMNSTFAVCSNLTMLPHNSTSYTFDELSAVTSANSMFATNANVDTSYIIDLSGFSSLTNATQMFYGWNNGNTAQIYKVNFAGLPEECNLSGMFSSTYIAVEDFGNVGTWCKTNSKTFSYISSYLSWIDKWDGIDLCDGVEGMFESTKLYSLPESWKGFNVTNASRFFMNCTGITEIPSSWEGAESIVIADSMFNGCTALTSIPDSWAPLKNIVSMDSFFSYCPLTSGGDSDIDVFTKVIAAANIFNGSAASFLTPSKVKKYCEAMTGSKLYWISKSGFTFSDYTNTGYVFPPEGGAPTAQYTYTAHQFGTSTSDWTTVLNAVDAYLTETYGYARPHNYYDTRYTFNGTSYSPGSSKYEISQSPSFQTIDGNYKWYGYDNVDGAYVPFTELLANSERYSMMYVYKSGSDEGDLEVYYLS